MAKAAEHNGEILLVLSKDEAQCIKHLTNWSDALERFVEHGRISPTTSEVLHLDRSRLVTVIGTSVETAVESVWQELTRLLENDT
jgi:hypothetical protein